MLQSRLWDTVSHAQIQSKILSFLAQTFLGSFAISRAFAIHSEVWGMTCHVHALWVLLATIVMEVVNGF